jgi:uncharacterized protein
MPHSANADMALMSQTIRTQADWERLLGTPPAPVKLKEIHFLDDGALRWIRSAPIMFAGFGGDGRVGVTLGGGVGFADGDATTLRLRGTSLDSPDLARPGVGFGSAFLLPGVTETLRVNGRVAAIAGDVISISVEECYGHCGKSLIRSDFWGASPIDAAPDVNGHVAGSRFMALATVDDGNRADLSPKGDPGGMMAHLEEGRILFADRPGNRRADSFRNLLTQPCLSALLLIPGSTKVARLVGRARLTTDEEARSRFVVQGKTPALVTEIDDLAIDLLDSPALRSAELWPARPATHGLSAPQIFLQHLRLNKDQSLTARLTKAALSVPGAQTVVSKGLAKDYKDNLY